MKDNLKGEILFETTRLIDEQKLDEMTTAIGTAAAPDTARLALFFGPTLTGEGRFVDAIELDLDRALLGGLSYRWTRPLEPGETVQVRVGVEDQYIKGDMQFAVVTTEVRSATDDVIQTQKATFIERGASA